MNIKNLSDTEKIVILDFGSQYSQLIARSIRELGAFTEILPPDISKEDLEQIPNIKGIVLSGGPHSVYDETAPLPGEFIYELGIPILGICYGLQAIAHQLGGEVEGSSKREYGKATLTVDKPFPLFERWDSSGTVWMSHGDVVLKLPEGFVSVGHTENSKNAVIQNEEKKIYGVQFHPEVKHTENGDDILLSFISDICEAHLDWTTSSFIETTLNKIIEKVGSSEVLCAISGGVDSSILSILLDRALGDKVHFIFVDTGLLRGGEVSEIRNNLGELLNLNIIDARERFLTNLRGIINPEEKRRIIGHTFIEVFEEYAEDHDEIEYLAQGTLYPDMIESRSVVGPSDEIKTHHNVGGLPEEMDLKLLEPFKFLFKDEVRKVGVELGVPEVIIRRHPFPGPGLAVRILGEVNDKNLTMLKKADTIAIDTLKKYNLYDEIAQALVVLLPIKSVGVMGDKRTYERPCVLRFVTTEDFMTADWAKIPKEVLAEISTRITNEVEGINRVLYDITTKPPATIEWE